MIRRPAAAGSFYPADPDELGTTVDGLLAEANAGEDVPRALVAPHAGYPYSGPVAASAYALLRGAEARRVALVGPAHFVPLRGSAVPAVEAWATPLGAVPVDDELRDVAVGAGAAVSDAPHAPEHALEVQLPFLQRLLGGDWAALPIAVGVSTAADAADLLALVVDAADVTIVSTDLSHYHDRATATRLDRRTADAVLARAPNAIVDDDACGVFALRGLVELVRRRDLDVRLLDLRTSADIAGDPRSVVGYGAFAVG